MTDKEMAVDWIRSQGWNEENLPSDEFGQMLEAYLAGLKAGRPVWHDLRKNPDDLPPLEKGTEFVSINVLTDRGEIACCQYCHGENCWRDCNWNEIYTPRAWCEIPGFKEEEKYEKIQAPNI